MKKSFTVILAVLLVVALSVGSAFALSVQSQKVSLPSAYSIMPLSLDDESTDRTVYNSNSIVFGGYTSSRRTTLTSSSRPVTAGTTVSDYLLGSLSASSSNTYVGGYFSVPSGTYIDVTSSVAISSSQYGSILVTGGGQFSLRCYGISSIPSLGAAYPNRAQFLVNGVPVGDYVTCSNGSFTLPDMTIELTEDVSSLGVRFTYTSAYTKSVTSGTYSTSIFLRCPFTDNINIAPVEKSATDYVPYFERVIGWLTSVFSSVNPLHDDLTAILSALSTGFGENGSLDRLASIFARDDDIELRDEMDDTLKEATDIFYNTTDNPSTSVSKDTVQEAGQTLQGMSTMFNSGYSAGDAFQEIADSKDDFLSWFSADTSSWLDTAPSTYSLEDDPYNMWMIEQQYAEIAQKRGEDN